MNVLLVYGGTSNEHEISKLSAKFVCTSLLEAGHIVYLCGVNKQGQWFLQLPIVSGTIEKNALFDGSALALHTPQDAQEADRLRLFTVPSLGIWQNIQAPAQLPIDIVFPLIHGHFGEDGTLQHLLDGANVPYVGCDAIASMCCISKYLAKEILRKHGIPVLSDIVVPSDTVLGKDDSIVSNIAYKSMELLGSTTIIVKPNDNGSSFGISCTESAEELTSALVSCAKYGKYILLEPFLKKKREIEVSVIGNDEGTIESFAPGEIVLHKGSFYDYSLKYHSSESQVSLCIPADIEDTVKRTICKYAEQSYLALGCRGFARIDFFLYTKEINNESVANSVVVNEINTIPGFTDISMFPKMVMNEGLSAAELMNKILSLVEKRE